MKSLRFVINFFTIIFLLPILTGCQFSSTDDIDEVASPETPVQYEQTVPFAETFFNLTIPAEVSEEIIIELVDDTTGIELNPTRYAMNQLTSTEYQIVLPLKLGSIIKYRYFRSGNLPIYEVNKFGAKIQYRVAYVSSAIEFSDIVTNWEDLQYEYDYGQIEGVVTSQNNSPIPNLLVSAGGITSFTNSLGKFTLSGLPAGKHNLVVLSTDGEYGVFQQEAMIGEGLTTPANIRLSAANFVNITFLMSPPAGGVNGMPIRILGNTYQLGNVFADVYNGVNNLASRSPKLTELPDGRYTITLSLPVGYDLRYKYSLGDGFWNAEQTADGNFNIRQLIVPSEDTVVDDVIYSWQAGNNNAPITFNVYIPENTDPNDIISIQFNPFGWTAPIPMTKISQNRWTYTLYGPFNVVNNISYRYCRNDACGVADDRNTLGNLTKGYTFTSSPLPQTFSDEVNSWFGWNPSSTPTTLVGQSIGGRGSDFVTGAYFSTRYNVFEPIYVNQAFQNLIDINSNTVIIPIEWTLSSFSPVKLEPIAGENPLWKDILSIIQKAQQKGLKVWLVPNVEINNQAVSQWNQELVSDSWQTQFIEEYQEFLLYTADLAAYMGIEGVVLPTNVIHVQSNINFDETDIIIQTAIENVFGDLRSHFGGKFYLEITDITFNNTSILNLIDGLLVDVKLSSTQTLSSIEEIQNSFTTIIDNSIYLYNENYNKPIWLGLNFPSAVGAETGCVLYGDECIDFQILNYLNSDMQSSVTIDLQKQADIYQAALGAINQTPWVDGVISYGYNPQVSLQDATSSVRGKPAADVLWYWNPRLLGLIQ